MSCWAGLESVPRAGNASSVCRVRLPTTAVVPESGPEIITAMPASEPNIIEAELVGPTRSKPRWRFAPIVVGVLVGLVAMRVSFTAIAWMVTAYRQATATAPEQVRFQFDPAPFAAADDDRTEQAPARPTGFYPEGADWQVPIPARLAPVFVEDYQRAGDRTEEAQEQHAEAVKQLRVADRLKADGDYAAAEKAYQEAIRLEPVAAIAAYQLACNYALWDKPDEAWKSFNQAIDMGFSEFPFCYQDEELGSIRTRPEFPEKLRVIRDRYRTESQQRMRAPVVFRPSTKPESGHWPVIFLLHGYGDTHESYFDEAEAWAASGVLAIAVPGTVPITSGYCWSTDDVASTHDAIQEILADRLLDNLIDRTKRVNLLGFSQGALHAAQIQLLHLDKYRGSVVISPGGRPWVVGEPYSDPSVDKTLFGIQKGRMFLVAGKQESVATTTKLEELLDMSGWRVSRIDHEGGHHFPADWEERRPQMVEFLLAN